MVFLIMGNTLSPSCAWQRMGKADRLGLAIPLNPTFQRAVCIWIIIIDNFSLFEVYYNVVFSRKGGIHLR